MSRSLAVLAILALSLGLCAAHSRQLLTHDPRGRDAGHGNGGGALPYRPDDRPGSSNPGLRPTPTPSPSPAPGTLSYRAWQPIRAYCIPDQNVTFCNGTTLRSLFTSNEIVPDLLGSDEMRYTVGVKLGFPGRLDVIGTYVNRSAADPPAVSFGPNFRRDRLHTLVMLDPDASARWNATNGPILHWLVTNVANGTVSSGSVAQPYRPPGPAFGNGLHRYVLLLLSQRGPINVAPVNQTDATARRRYDLYRLINTYDLEVQGGTFFFSQN